MGWLTEIERVVGDSGLKREVYNNTNAVSELAVEGTMLKSPAPTKTFVMPGGFNPALVDQAALDKAMQDYWASQKPTPPIVAPGMPNSGWDQPKNQSQIYVMPPDWKEKYNQADGGINPILPTQTQPATASFMPANWRNVVKYGVLATAAYALYTIWRS